VNVFEALSLPALLLLFTGAATAVWFAGIRLVDATDVLSERFDLGEALGGLILLAIVTNLPEVAITASASLGGNIGVAVGNILGGIAIQTVVLAGLDAFGVRGSHPLTYRAASLVLVLEGVLVIAVLTTAVAGSQLPGTLLFGRVEPGDLLIVVLWVAGIYLLTKARTGLPWQERHIVPGQELPRGHSKAQKAREARNSRQSTARTVVVFTVAAVVTLVGGVILERSGSGIAESVGMSGILFGSTFLAAATALPEVSTGLASVKLEDYQLAVSDIFGGNAFLPVLFFVATLLSGEAVLPHVQDTDIYLTGVGIFLTAVYVWGLIFRPRRRFLRMGIDSLVVLVVYLLGLLGLVAVAYG
jgi:cation:H+ antiporter